MVSANLLECPIRPRLRLAPGSLGLMRAAETYCLFKNISFRRPKLSLNEAGLRATCGEQAELNQGLILFNIFIFTHALKRIHILISSIGG
jgi:hypothetical protein